ncbi:hypothetical protein KEJ17_02890 [Candidatus Bathyarchaeota archaeon]|nr:hypothetical protein [Candidatus Bathyarchaeota archaeon]
MVKRSPFWSRVRELIREKAVELYMLDHMHLGVFNTPTERELKEGGYYERAKRIILRQIALEKPLKTLEELEEEEL